MSTEPQIEYAKTSDGVNIAYAVLGEGTPLVVLPNIFFEISLFSKMPSFANFTSQLAEKHQVILYDNRGFGLSQRDAHRTDVEDDVRDLEAVISAADLPKCALFASTLAGPHAIAYAARHHDQVAHLLLYATFARATDVISTEQLGVLADLCRTNWDLGAQLLADMSHREAFPEDGTILLREWKANARGGDVADQLEIGYATDVTGLPSDVHVPTLVIHRRDDSVIPFSVSQVLAARISDARFVPLDGSVHGFMLGDSGPLLGAIGAFLGDAVRSRPGVADSGPFRTILFTDIVGHTEMMQRLGDAKGRDVLREHERLTRETLRAHGGAEVKTMGDGFMASFGSVTSAVDCAIALQRGFATWNAQRAGSGLDGAEASSLRVRVGLNAGEPIEEDGDLFGATVILASRIAAKAGGGEILVPETVRGLLSGKGFVFGDRGEFVPKGFDEGVRLYEVRWREPEP